MIAHTFFHHYTKLIVASIVYPFTSRILSCKLILSQDNHLILILLYYVILIQEVLLILILILMTKTFTFLGMNHLRKPPLCLHRLNLNYNTTENIHTAQDACIYSEEELDQFWNRILSSKHSDTTLQLLERALSYSFIFTNSPNYSDSHISQTNPYSTLRNGLHDKLLNLTPRFTPTCFFDAFITLFGYPCYIFTQTGIYFSIFLFIQTLLTLLIKLYK